MTKTTTKTNYVRLTFRTRTDDIAHLRTVWAKKISSKPNLHIFVRLTKEGDEPDPRELIMLADTDIIREQAAEMDLHYGQFKVTFAS